MNPDVTVEVTLSWEEAEAAARCTYSTAGSIFATTRAHAKLTQAARVALAMERVAGLHAAYVESQVRP